MKSTRTTFAALDAALARVPNHSRSTRDAVPRGSHSATPTPEQGAMTFVNPVPSVMGETVDKITYGTSFRCCRCSWTGLAVTQHRRSTSPSPSSPTAAALAERSHSVAGWTRRWRAGAIPDVRIVQNSCSVDGLWCAAASDAD